MAVSCSDASFSSWAKFVEMFFQTADRRCGLDNCGQSKHKMSLGCVWMLCGSIKSHVVYSISIKYF